ncbi:MAG: holo-ACP synthase [Candidatus Marinimicrobia bacterium]|jgi:holo-[acyl-carrier protein] synthase|nr:holo-ACP synthase [Candidatus Neomarinimicrobiota bacterium]MDP6592768.1 holo-ACP synthase [Candidatus Neomarinimicrobiota bacterium]MDP6836289.1 holo-ACP synthase [Candidatus Neomarinimicrobiota bacterium]
MQNNYAVGTDIVEIDRIREMHEHHGERFFNHIFSRQEVAWCKERADPDIHLAGRFAAKEAVKKALLTLGEKNIPLIDIEILRDDGPPSVNVGSSIKNKYDFQISISHTQRYATAVAIVECR